MNQTPEVPAGTRCQCTDASHGDAHYDWGDEKPSQCLSRRAVRMVTVFVDHRGNPDEPHTETLPMCSACAEYHESKVAK